MVEGVRGGVEGGAHVTVQLLVGLDAEQVVLVVVEGGVAPVDAGLVHVDDAAAVVDVDDRVTAVGGGVDVVTRAGGEEGDDAHGEEEAHWFHQLLWTNSKKSFISEVLRR